MAQLQISHLSKKFKGKIALQDVNLDLQAGIYGLLGPNGAGKTTLLRSIASVYEVPKNCICFEGVDASNKKYCENIGYLPQCFSAFGDLTVEEMLQYFCLLRNMDKKVGREEIDRVLDKVHLSEERRKKVSRLSGGMLRRLGIAQCLLGDVGMLLFDEPTVGLDPEERMKFRLLLTEDVKEKIVIISSHIVSDLKDTCNYIIVLDEGKIKAVGSKEEITQNAKNKVFEVEESSMNQISGDYTVVDRYEVNDSNYMRIVSGQRQPFPSLLPTLEDGYLCFIKDY